MDDDEPMFIPADDSDDDFDTDSFPPGTVFG